MVHRRRGKRSHAQSNPENNADPKCNANSSKEEQTKEDKHRHPRQYRQEERKRHQENEDLPQKKQKTALTEDVEATETDDAKGKSQHDNHEPDTLERQIEAWAETTTGGTLPTNCRTKTNEEKDARRQSDEKPCREDERIHRTSQTQQQGNKTTGIQERKEKEWKSLKPTATQKRRREERQSERTAAQARQP